MFAAIIGCSIVAFFAVIIGSASGAAANDGFSRGVWPFVIMFPWFGLPIAFILLITLLIVNAVRRSREARGGSS